MNEDTLNMQIRKFLKKVGISSQREIEKAVSEALKTGELKGDEKLLASMTLEMPSLGVNLKIKGEILLEK